MRLVAFFSQRDGFENTSRPETCKCYENNVRPGQEPLVAGLFDIRPGQGPFGAGGSSASLGTCSFHVEMSCSLSRDLITSDEEK